MEALENNGEKLDWGEKWGVTTKNTIISLRHASVPGSLYLYTLWALELKIKPELMDLFLLRLLLPLLGNTVSYNSKDPCRLQLWALNEYRWHVFWSLKVNEFSSRIEGKHVLKCGLFYEDSLTVLLILGTASKTTYIAGVQKKQAQPASNTGGVQIFWSIIMWLRIWSKCHFADCILSNA